MKLIKLQGQYTLSQQADQQGLERPNPPDPQEVIDSLNAAQTAGLISADEHLQETLQARLALGNLTYDEAVEAVRHVVTTEASRKALDAVKTLFRPGDVIEFCALYLDGTVAAICGDVFDPEQERMLRKFVAHHFAKANLYIGVCPRKSNMAGQRRRATSVDVKNRRHVVLDLDFKDAPDADADWSRTLSELRNRGPVLIVQSGNGWQVWFEIEEQTGGQLSASAALLSEALALIGSDKVHDAPRLMRLPYTPNIPSEAKRTRGAVWRFALPDSSGTKRELAA